MSYTVEAIDSSASAAPQNAPKQATIMKEERVVDPYSRVKINEALQQQKDDLGVPAQTENSQPNTSSGANESVESKTEESVTLTPHMAALARKEQKFRKEQQRLKDEQTKLEAEKAEIAELKSLKDKIASGDLSALESVGVTYDKYTEYLINKDKGTDPNQLEIKKLKDEINGLKKSTEENISKQFEAAVSERRQAVNKLVETDPSFTRIKKANAQEAVLKHILDTWEHESVELSVEDAAKEVNAFLGERAKQWAALVEEQKAQSQDEGEKKPLPPMNKGIKTITNQMTAGDVKRAVKPLWQYPESERYAEARRRAEEKLKQGK